MELAGKPVSAMVYVMNPGYALGVPSESYYRTIAQGYRSAGFDLETLDAAVEESYQRSLVENFEDFSEEYEVEDVFGSPDFMHL